MNYFLNLIEKTFIFIAKLVLFTLNYMNCKTCFSYTYPNATSKQHLKFRVFQYTFLLQLLRSSFLYESNNYESKIFLSYKNRYLQLLQYIHYLFNIMPRTYYILIYSAVSAILNTSKNTDSRVGFCALSVIGTGSCPVNEKLSCGTKFASRCYMIGILPSRSGIVLRQKNKRR